MISIYAVIGILFLHWIADFVCQTDWMAKNKSKNNLALGLHVLVYGAVFFFALAPVGIELSMKFFLITTPIHFIQDYITSRINTKLYEKGKIHYFFVSIGFDQFLHFVQLLITYQMLIQ